VDLGGLNRKGPKIERKIMLLEEKIDIDNFHRDKRI
jgi:hypothetical protein